jgi:hypothetical protein
VSGEDAFVAWDHHEGVDARDQDDWSIKKMMRVAFLAGWASAGGDERLLGIASLQDEMAECPCSDPGDVKICAGCRTLKRVRKLLGDEVDE